MGFALDFRSAKLHIKAACLLLVESLFYSSSFNEQKYTYKLHSSVRIMGSTSIRLVIFTNKAVNLFREAIVIT